MTSDLESFRILYHFSGPPACYVAQVRTSDLFYRCNSQVVESGHVLLSSSALAVRNAGPSGIARKLHVSTSIVYIRLC